MNTLFSHSFINSFCFFLDNGLLKLLIIILHFLFPEKIFFEVKLYYPLAEFFLYTRVLNIAVIY